MACAQSDSHTCIAILINSPPPSVMMTLHVKDELSGALHMQGVWENVDAFARHVPRLAVLHKTGVAPVDAGYGSPVAIHGDVLLVEKRHGVEVLHLDAVENQKVQGGNLFHTRHVAAQCLVSKVTTKATTNTRVAPGQGT